MPFTAACPHCRRCRLRVPRRKRGRSFHCPKCHEEFLLVPLDEADSVTGEGPEVAVESSVARQLKTAAPVPMATDAIALARVAIGAAAVAFVLGLLPYGRVAALIVGLFGLGTAVVGVLEKPVGGIRRGWLGLVLNALLLALVTVYPHVLGIKGWWVGPGERTAESPPADDRLDAGEMAWQHGGVRVGLTFATVGPDPSAASGKERYIWIGVKVTNVSAGDQLEFTGWPPSGADHPALTTPDGAILDYKRWLGPSGKTLIAVGKSIEGMMGFAVPPDSQDLLMDVPTKPLGDTAIIRFRIARDLLGAK